MWLNQSEQHRPIVQSKRTSKILLHVHINGVFEKEKFNTELFLKKTTTKRHIIVMVFCWGTAWPAADRGLYRKKNYKVGTSDENTVIFSPRYVTVQIKFFVKKKIKVRLFWMSKLRNNQYRGYLRILKNKVV